MMRRPGVEVACTPTTLTREQWAAKSAAEQSRRVQQKRAYPEEKEHLPNPESNRTKKRARRAEEARRDEVPVRQGNQQRTFGSQAPATFGAMAPPPPQNHTGRQERRVLRNFRDGVRIAEDDVWADLRHDEQQEEAPPRRDREPARGFFGSASDVGPRREPVIDTATQEAIADLRTGFHAMAAELRALRKERSREERGREPRGGPRTDDQMFSGTLNTP